jgi:diguanylate cyclase
MHDQVRDTGEQLAEQLDSVSKAIAAAQRTSLSYGKTLAGASKELADAQGPEALKKLVDNLTDATRLVHEQNKKLEKRLQASTREVADLRDHLEQVRRDALTDALTQLANRKAFDEQLMRACLAADSSGTPLALALLDIDHFKKFNDTWGHQTGDQVLRFVASVLDRSATGARFAARYGGEEFVILFPGEHPNVVMASLEQIREEISSRVLKRRSTNEDLGAVTISIGMATLKPGESCASLTERADKALYFSKRNGRNRVTDAEAMARPVRAA